MGEIWDWHLWLEAIETILNGGSSILKNNLSIISEIFLSPWFEILSVCSFWFLLFCSLYSVICGLYNALNFFYNKKGCILQSSPWNMFLLISVFSHYFLMSIIHCHFNYMWNCITHLGKVKCIITYV
jgi:hypothetical protein